MSHGRSPFGKPQPVDYIVLIGGPLLAMIIVVWGLMSLIGPPPPPNPIQKLRDGEVSRGMSVERVIEVLGPPKEQVKNEDGSVTLRYQHGADEAFVEDDGYVDISPGGFVTNVAVERTRVNINEDQTE